MKKKIISVVAILLSVSLCFTACGDGDKKGNKPATNTNTEKDAVQSKLDVLKPTAYSSVDGLALEPGSYISIIGRFAGDSYWKEVEEGAKKAVADLNSALGYKGDDKIKLTYSAPETRDDVNEQINILDEELARYRLQSELPQSTRRLVRFNLTLLLKMEFRLSPLTREAIIRMSVLT